MLSSEKREVIQAELTSLLEKAPNLHRFPVSRIVDLGLQLGWTPTVSTSFRPDIKIGIAGALRNCILDNFKFIWVLLPKQTEKHLSRLIGTEDWEPVFLATNRWMENHYPD